jgi:hypothetical protein
VHRFIPPTKRAKALLAKLTVATLAVTGSTFIASAVPAAAVPHVTGTFSAASAFAGRVWFMVYKGGVESAGTLWEFPAGSWDPNAPALN